MSNFFKNPVAHGFLVFIVMILGFFLQSGSPILTMTIGAAAAAALAYLSGILG